MNWIGLKNCAESAGGATTSWQRTTPSIVTLRRVCSAMGITMAEFYKRDGISTVLTENQKALLDHYNVLDSRSKDKAMAYIKGLADGRHDA